jgi:hypothetical protein
MLQHLCDRLSWGFQRRNLLAAGGVLTVGSLLQPFAEAAVATAGTFTIKHLYTGDDGLSHFRDLVLRDGDGGGPGALFLRKAKEAALRIHQPGKVMDWHNSGGSRLIFYLQGEAEMGLSDGSSLRFRPGMLLLAEDRTGKGHNGRILGPDPSVNFDILLADA